MGNAPIQHLLSLRHPAGHSGRVPGHVEWAGYGCDYQYVLHQPVPVFGLCIPVSGYAGAHVLRHTGTGEVAGLSGWDLPAVSGAADGGEASVHDGAATHFGHSQLPDLLWRQPAGGAAVEEAAVPAQELPSDHPLQAGGQTGQGADRLSAQVLCLRPDGCGLSGFGVPVLLQMRWVSVLLYGSYQQSCACDGGMTVPAHAKKDTHLRVGLRDYWNSNNF